MLRDTAQEIGANGHRADENQAVSAVSPGLIAKQCLEEADGDWEQAAQLMEARVLNDDALYKEVALPLIKRAVWALVRGASRKKRQTFFSNRRVGKDTTTGIKAVAAMNWLDYPLMGGQKLGDATREDLQKNIEKHVSDAKENEKKANWLSRIQSGVVTVVRDSLSSDKIAELAEEVGL